MNMKKQILFLFSLLVIILTGCGKYENGPGLSLRSKNARISGEWKLVKSNYTWNNPLDATENESSVFDGNNVTVTYQEPIYDIFGEIMGYTNVSSSYPYSEKWEIETKDNSIIISSVEDGISSVTNRVWSWNDGASSKEIIEIGGASFIIKRLTNKEMELFVEYKEDGATETMTLTFEKE
jgi:hypothetical protein